MMFLDYPGFGVYVKLACSVAKDGCSTSRSFFARCGIPSLVRRRELATSNPSYPRLRRRSIAAENKRGIGAAETKGIGHGVLHRGRLALVLHQRKSASFI